MDGFPRNASIFASGSPADGLFAVESQPQRSLKAAIDCVGIALHSGARVAMTLAPAACGTGIVFRRRDLGVDIPARFDLVGDTRLCTVLAHPAIAAARVGTVEHVMAALSGAGITNAIIEVDGPELPILDGSATGLAFLIDCAGTVEQEHAVNAIAPTRAVRVEGAQGAFVELLPLAPGEAGLHLTASIDFPAAAIGAQAFEIAVTPASFRRELAPARTFCLLAEVEAMQEAGLARGGSLDNAVVVDGDQVLNPAGLRMEREFVRHKLLDMVGDLALAGVVLHARVRAHRPGHGLNNAVLRALVANPANWQQTAGDSRFDVAAPPLAALG
jgi:UDP-3-O-[3-hydroxymyristoyl] N-acetylglucosamine deacetylase